MPLSLDSEALVEFNSATTSYSCINEGKGKKCCDRFRLGLCNNDKCPFPHVEEATKRSNVPQQIKIVSVSAPVVLLGSRGSVVRNSFAEFVKPKLKATNYYQHLGYDEAGTLLQHCKRCALQFELNTGEVAYFERKGLHLPKTCRECRAVMRAGAL